MSNELVEGTSIDQTLYLRILRYALCREMELSDSVLVICGSVNDSKLFQYLGFTNVTISNIDERINELDNPFEPFAWSFQNAEALAFDDDHFDWVVVHAGLHHLKCPQLGIAEMIRVSRKGCIGIEPHESLLTRLGVMLGGGQQYETAAVQANDFEYGGVNNSCVPNFVYRWRKNEILKAAKSYEPAFNFQYHFIYEMVLPGRLERLRNPLMRIGYGAIGRLISKFGRYVPALSNNFAFLIQIQGAELQRWLVEEQGQVKPCAEYFEREYL